jgi:TP901 family phage tail tape measure protein
MAGENLGSKIGSAFIQVGAVFTGFGESLASDVSNAFLAQTFVVGQALEGFGQAVFSRFSVPLIAATAANIVQFQALDREIRTVLTLFGTAESLVDDTFGAMAEGVREVALDVGGLEKDIADGLYGAISAGVPRGGVFDFLNVAQMAAIADKTADLTSAVDGLTTVTNAFGLEFDEVGEIADVMFATVALGKTTFGELANDIGRVAPLAANAGVAFQELFAVVGALTLQGLKTSEAISFLRAGITGILRPTEELNAVFQEAGFASAEAAIPVIGLQAAFQTVVDAVGGSTSKLQELIGTSEGVSAILGVTGDNADNFAKVMGGVDNATGGLTRAFEIMDGSVGRTFGRLTEAFDRLGNTFGEMASQFAVPVFDTVTNVIDRMVEIFSNFRPIVEGLAVAFGSFISLLNLPIIRDLAAIFGSIAIAIGGTIGALGLFALTLGKIIIAGVNLKLVQTAWKFLGATILATQAHLRSVGATLVASQAAMSGVGGAAGVGAKAITGFGRALQLIGKNPFLFAGGILAVVAAFGLLASAIGGAIQRQKEYIASQDIFGKGVDTLLESMGLLNQELSVPGAEEGATNLASFAIENLALLQTIEKTREELGEIAAIDLAEALVVRVVLAGNTTEEALELQDVLRKFTGLHLSVDASDLENSRVIIENFAEGALSASELLNVAQAEATAESLVDLFSAVQTSGDLDVFESTFDEIVGLNDGIIRSTALADALERQFESTFGVKIDKGLLGKSDVLLDFETLIGLLGEAGVQYQDLSEKTKRDPIESTPEQLFAFSTEGFGTDVFADLATPEQLAAAEGRVATFGISLAEALTLPDGSVDIYNDLITGMESVFSTAAANMQASMDAIGASLAAQNPLLDIYAGKITQSFAEWKTGQDQFQTDVAAVTGLREELIAKDLPGALIDAFDRAPIEKQAWLAGLGAGELETALEEMQETFSIIDENTKLRILQSAGTLMTEFQTEINAGYSALQNEALLAAPIVADNFNKEFDAAAAQWEITANNWMTAIENAISRPLAGPVIGSPTFGGLPSIPGGGEGDITINVDGSGDANAGDSVTRALISQGLVN